VAQETEQSKRARQKQRREERLARERVAAARARRNRLFALAGVGLVIVAVVGLVIAQQVQRRAAERENIAAAEARLDDLGCTPIEAADGGGAGNHLAAEQLAQSPPSEIYPDRPAAGGPHTPGVSVPGVYDKQIDERILVHNLEHGAVNLYWGPDADPAQVDQLRTWAQERFENGFNEITAAPYGDGLPEGANFGIVSWGFRQTCRDFDAGVAQAFLDQHYNTAAAPEQFTPAGAAGQGGVLDPNESDGPLLLPPLSDEPVGEAATPAPGSSDSPVAPEVPTPGALPAPEATTVP